MEPQVPDLHVVAPDQDAGAVVEAVGERSRERHAFEPARVVVEGHVMLGQHHREQRKLSRRKALPQARPDLDLLLCAATGTGREVGRSREEVMPTIVQRRAVDAVEMPVRASWGISVLAWGGLRAVAKMISERR